jgi:hypothetical protein
MHNPNGDDALFERLRRANPVPIESIRGSMDSIAATAMLEEIVRAPRSRIRVRRSAINAGLRRAIRLDELDPYDRLAASNPSPLASVARFSGGDQAGREALLDSIVSGAFVPGAAWNRRGWRNALAAVALRLRPPSMFRQRRLDDLAPARVRWHPRRSIAIPILGASILFASAAGVVLAREHATKPSATTCFASDSYGPSSNAIGVVGPDAVSACAKVWLEGAFGAPRTPHLVACILPTGFVGVFPGSSDKLCTKLNLSVALPPAAHVRAIAEFRLALDHDIGLHGTSRCVSLGDARTIVRADLATYGLSGWRITVPSPPTAQRRCATPFIQLPNLVRLIMVPPPRT